MPISYKSELKTEYKTDLLGRYGQIPLAVGFVYQNESCEFDFRQC
jgi:hypothetical protein